MDINQISTIAIQALIGLLTIFYSRQQIKISEKNIQTQIDASKELAKLDINKTVLSGNRQEWINTLRNLVAEYIAYLTDYVDREMQSFEKGNEEHTFEESYRQMHHNLLKTYNKIILMLNPDEQESKELKTEIGKLLAALAIEKATFMDKKQHEDSKRVFPVNEIRERVLSITGKILKNEWNRVKQGE
jgi:hypothetical protein